MLQKKDSHLQRGATAVEYLMMTAAIALILYPIAKKTILAPTLGAMEANRGKLVSFVAQDRGRPKPVPNEWFAVEPSPTIPGGTPPGPSPTSPKPNPNPSSSDNSNGNPPPNQDDNPFRTMPTGNDQNSLNRLQATQNENLPTNELGPNSPNPGDNEKDRIPGDLTADDKTNLLRKDSDRRENIDRDRDRKKQARNSESEEFESEESEDSRSLRKDRNQLSANDQKRMAQLSGKLASPKLAGMGADDDDSGSKKPFPWWWLLRLLLILLIILLILWLVIGNAMSRQKS